MAGKLCFGEPTNNAAKVRNSKSFCEGRYYRALGTETTHPKEDNPHEAGTEAATAWDLGWDDAEAGTGTYVGPSGCCAALGDVATGV